MGGRGGTEGGGAPTGEGAPDHAGGRAERYASYAWRLVGLFRSQAGWLDLRGGRLRYSTPAGVVFDVPLIEVSGLAFPWHYSNGGLKLKVAGEEYRLAFVEPNGARFPAAQCISAGAERTTLASVAAAAEAAGTGRKVGREWRRLLEGRTAS